MVIYAIAYGLANVVEYTVYYGVGLAIVHKGSNIAYGLANVVEYTVHYGVGLAIVHKGSNIYSSSWGSVRYNAQG